MFLLPAILCAAAGIISVIGFVTLERERKGSYIAREGIEIGCRGVSLRCNRNLRN